MPKTAITGTLLSLEIDKTSSVPIYRQIADRLREAVSAGRISAGSKLPSTRIFAEELNVSRNTVLQVFDTLINEGFLISRVGAGTYVSGESGKYDEPGQLPTESSNPGESHYPFRSLSRRGKISFRLRPMHSRKVRRHSCRIFRTFASFRFEPGCAC
jgi:GntR family transcriptional regulator/MocR family aminotransferase